MHSQLCFVVEPLPVVNLNSTAIEAGEILIQWQPHNSSLQDSYFVSFIFCIKNNNNNYDYVKKKLLECTLSFYYYYYLYTIVDNTVLQNLKF